MNLRITKVFFLSFLALFNAVSGCSGDNDVENDVIPPTIKLYGPCNDQCFPNCCFREDTIEIVGSIADENEIMEGTISFGGTTSPISLDERGFFRESFSTEKCLESDDTYCNNLIIVTAVDDYKNTATDECIVTYIKTYVPRRLIVSFYPDTTEDRIIEINQGIGAEIIKEMDIDKHYLVLLPVGTSLEEGISYYTAQPEVDYAVRDRIYCS